MGIFSSKKKTVVSSSVARLIPDEGITNRLKKAIIDQVLNKSPHSGIGEAIIAEAPQRLQKKFVRADTWASRVTPANYTYGDLKSNFITTETAAAENEILSQLTAIHGATTEIKYFIFNDPHVYHVAWDKLINVYGYSFISNKLNILSTEYGTDCFLKTGQVRYCAHTVNNIVDATYLEPIGLSFEHGVTFDRVQDYSRAAVDWVKELVIDKDMFSFTFVLKVIKTNEIKKNITNNSIISNTNTYDVNVPSLFESVVETLTNTTVNTVDTTETTTKTYDLTYTINREFDLLEYEFSGSVSEVNALEEADGLLLDATLVDETVVTEVIATDYFMCQYSYVDTGVTYYGLFTYAYGSGANTLLDNVFTDGLEIGNHLPKIYFRKEGYDLAEENRRVTQEYKDSKRYAKRLGLNYLDLSTQLHENIGSLDKVKQIAIGAYIAINDMQPFQIEYMFHYWDKIYNNSTALFNSTNEVGLNAIIYNTSFVDYTHKQGRTIVFKDNVSQLAVSFKSVSKRVTTTAVTTEGIGETTYTQVTPTYSHPIGSTIIGLCHVFSKRIDSTTIIDFMINDLQSHETVQSGYTAVATKTDDALIIPLDLSLLYKLTSNKQEILCGQCLYIIINTSQVIKTRWYQRGAFKVLLIVIAIVLALPSGGASLTLLVVLQTIAIVILTQIALTLVIRVVIRLLNLSAEVAAALYIAGALYTGNFNFSNLVLLAKDLLAILNVAFKVVSVGVEEEYKRLLEEKRKFSVTQAEQLKLIEEAYDQLDIGNYVYDPLFTPTNSTMHFYLKLGDTSETYLSKSQLSTEIPSIIVGFISNFTEVMLQLPEPKYRLGV